MPLARPDSCEMSMSSLKTFRGEPRPRGEGLGCERDQRRGLSELTLWPQRVSRRIAERLARADADKRDLHWTDQFFGTRPREGKRNLASTERRREEAMSTRGKPSVRETARRAKLIVILRTTRPMVLHVRSSH